MFPELMELSFGCKLEHKGEGGILFISEKFCQKPEHDSEHGCNNSDYCNNLACFRLSDERVIYGNNWTPYKIIGHKVTHIHILRALNKLDRFDGIVSITAEGYITSLEMDVKGLGYKVDICKLDLSQPWQTQEEAVEKLYNLICAK